MKGFTLIEVLVAAATASVAGVLLITVLVQNNGLVYDQSAKVSQSLNLNDTTSQINDLVKNASAIVTTNLIGSPTYTTNAATLVLSLPSLDASGNIISDTFDYAVITKDSDPQILKKIIFKAPASTRKVENKVLASKLDAVSFLYLDDNGNTVSPTAATKINYTINLKQRIGVGNEQSSTSGQINLRNN